MRRHGGADLDHDLRVPEQRDATGLAAPPSAVDKHADPAAAGRTERRHPLRRQRHTPGAKQIRQHQPRTWTHEHHPRWLERHQAAIAARRDDPPTRHPARWPRADPGWHDHHAVGSKHLDVDPVARPQQPPAPTDHRARRGRMKLWPPTDRPRLRKQPARDRRRQIGGRPRRPAAGQQRHRADAGESPWQAPQTAQASSQASSSSPPSSGAGS